MHTHCDCGYCAFCRATADRRCTCTACANCEECKTVAARRDTIHSANLHRPEVERFWLVIAIGCVNKDSGGISPIHPLYVTKWHTSYASAHSEMKQLTRTIGGVFGVFELVAVARGSMMPVDGTIVDPPPF